MSHLPGLARRQAATRSTKLDPNRSVHVSSRGPGMLCHIPGHESFAIRHRAARGGGGEAATTRTVALSFRLGWGPDDAAELTGHILLVWLKLLALNGNPVQAGRKTLRNCVLDAAARLVRGSWRRHT